MVFESPRIRPFACALLGALASAMVAPVAQAKTTGKASPAGISRPSPKAGHAASAPATRRVAPAGTSTAAPGSTRAVAPSPSATAQPPLMPTEHPNVMVRFTPSTGQPMAGAPGNGQIYVMPGTQSLSVARPPVPRVPAVPQVLRLPNGALALDGSADTVYAVASVQPSGAIAIRCQDPAEVKATPATSKPGAATPAAKAPVRVKAQEGSPR